MFILVFSMLFAQVELVEEALWELRAGNIIVYHENLPTISILYHQCNQDAYVSNTPQDLLVKISMGDRSLLPLLVSRLVSEGETELAEFYWQSDGDDLPPTRIEMLELLAWFGRFELYPLISLNPPVPPDLEDSQYSNDCAAICAIGWMRPRSDGLFHGEELVSPEDLQLLFDSFPDQNPAGVVRSLGSIEQFIERAFATGGHY